MHYSTSPCTGLQVLTQMRAGWTKASIMNQQNTNPQKELIELQRDLMVVIEDISTYLNENYRGIRSPEYLALKEKYYYLKHRIKELQSNG